ncbi:MAG: xanthosine triphosphate pyrophosphatase [Burkholderiales bacterium]|nr:MAG: xanthosine triphosphate pyrophosphatase [Burkholderiales bacterium]
MKQRRTRLKELFYSADRLPEVHFYTSNEQKFLQARQVFARSGLRLRHSPSHTEPYDEDYSHGREHLLFMAIEQVRRVTGGTSIFFVEDTSVVIHALSRAAEFPGLAVKEWFSTTTFQDLDAQLAALQKGRGVTVKSDIALSIPGLGRPILLAAETTGSVADTPPNFPQNPQYPWLSPHTFNGWFVPEGALKRLGEMSFEESLEHDFRVRALDEVVDRIEEFTAILNLPTSAFSRRRKQTASGQMLLVPGVRRAVVVIGKTCAGKSTFGEYASDQGFKWIEASEVVRSLREQSTDKKDSTEEFAKALLSNSGHDIVARNVLRLLESDSNDPFVITGFRALEEIELLLREVPQVEIVLIESSERTRYERFVVRNRDGRGESLSSFRAKDQGHWDFGLLSVAEDFSSVVIENEGSMEEYRAQIDAVLSNNYDIPGVRLEPYSSRRTNNSQLVRCLRVLNKAGRALDCNEISDGTANSGARIRFNNVNKMVKRYPTLAQRLESGNEKVRYQITDAGRTYLRMLENSPQ